MPESVPVGGLNELNLDFKFETTDEFNNAFMDASGMRPPKRWEFAVDLHTEISDPALRRRFREVHAIYLAVEGYPRFPKTFDDAEEFLAHIEAWAAEQSLAQGIEQQEPGETFESQMAAWIPAHGSPRLRSAFERGYKVNRLYTTERAAVELPGAWIDTSGTAELRERTDPSADGLAFEAAVGEHLAELDAGLRCRILWVVEPPSSTLHDAEGEEVPYFGENEAVVVSPYLGRYQAIIPVDADYRAPVLGESR